MGCGWHGAAGLASSSLFCRARSKCAKPKCKYMLVFYPAPSDVKQRKKKT